MENLTLSDIEAYLTHFETVSLVVLAAFALSLLLILKRIGISEFFGFVFGSLIVLGVPCFIAHYFFDAELITASTSNPDKVELTLMSYVVMALSIMAGFGYKSKAQKEAEETAEREAEEAKQKAQKEKQAEQRALSKAAKKRKAEERAKEEAEEQAKLEKEAEELRVYLASFPEDIVDSFNKQQICIDMPMELVGKLKGEKYEEKRNVTKKAEKLTYKYGIAGTNNRGNNLYQLEVTYIDGLVDSFKDL